MARVKQQAKKKEMKDPKMPTTATGGQPLPKKRRFKPGTKALQEIRKFQKTTNLILPRAAFARVVREIAQDIVNNRDIRFQKPAINALQEAAEEHLVNLLEDVQLAAVHSKRVTIQKKDLLLAQRLRGKK
jgi:histone H3/H4